ncbi:hypothetical protein [Coraliomargarita parva]|uniref:hypothetical protein n=1 Tax=Coraliomargarita parva TaxID=3014050 RepID=UPI0022B31BBD|nr:hypothetical protein [Coraliomargarita parva]
MKKQTIYCILLLAAIHVTRPLFGEEIANGDFEDPSSVPFASQTETKSQYQPQIQSDVVLDGSYSAKITRDNNVYANPPVLLIRFGVLSDTEQMTVSFAAENTQGSRLVFRIRTADATSYYDGSTWQSLSYAQRTDYHQLNWGVDAVSSTQVDNIAARTFQHYGDTLTTPSFQISPIPGQLEYVIEFYNTVVNTSLYLDNVSVVQAVDVPRHIYGNSVSNGDFESGDTSNWSTLAYSQYSPQVLGTSAIDGDYGVKLTRDNNSWANPPGLSYQFTKVANNFPIHISFSAQNDGGSLLFRLRTPGSSFANWNGSSWTFDNALTPRTQYFQRDWGTNPITLALFDNFAANTLIYSEDGVTTDFALTAEGIDGQSTYQLDFYNTKAGTSSHLDNVVVEGQRRVMIHVMPAFPPGADYGTSYTSGGLEEEKNFITIPWYENRQDRIERHLMEMSDYGFDIVSLDVFLKTDYESGDAAAACWQHNQILEWLDAIEKVAPHMKFVVQVDRAMIPTGGADKTAAALDAMIACYKEYPAYLKIDGKAALNSFWINQSLSYQADYWGDVRDAMTEDPYFIASVYDNPGSSRSTLDEEAAADLLPVFDAVEWNPLANYTSWVSNCDTLAEMTESPEIPMVWGVISGYYRKGTSFVEPQFENWDLYWSNATASPTKDSYACVYTWNDIAEDHDVAPGIHKEKGAMATLLNYYIEWYKSGQEPALDQDVVIVNYQVTDNGHVVFRNGNENPNGLKPHYWIYTTDDGTTTFTLAGGGSVQLQGKGLHMGTLPYELSADWPTTYSLVRNSQTIVQGTVPTSQRMIHLEDEEAENQTSYWLYLEDQGQ